MTAAGMAAAGITAGPAAGAEQAGPTARGGRHDRYRGARGTYALDNAAAQAGQRFAALSAVCDPVTVRHLDAVGIAQGWHCLEVGAGDGSVARWMAERVGPGGHVLAVDLDTRWTRGPFEIRTRDVRTDELPEAAFDLVHARLVLLHLPERADVLARLVRALKPGGWLVTSDFTTMVVAGPPATDERSRVLDTVNRAFGALLTSRGADLAYGRRLGPAYVAAGLTGVCVDGHVTVGWGGGAYARLLRANLEQVRDELVGVTDDDVERYLVEIDDPAQDMLGPALFTARGRRPA
ncbi:MAG: class I SAM-dependent methyltransferase [Pseudonocardia sp.]